MLRHDLYKCLTSQWWKSRCLITIFQNYVTVWILEEHQLILHPQPKDCKLSLRWLRLEVFLCEDLQNESDTSRSLSLRRPCSPTCGLKLSASFPFLLTSVLWSRLSYLGRSPAGGNGNPLQYSCQDNPMDRGAWQVRGVPKNWTQLKWVSSLRKPYPPFFSYPASFYLC